MPIDHGGANGAQPDQGVGNNTQQKRDYVQALTAAITGALEQHTQAEVVIVKEMQDRAALYEKAFVQAKQALIDATKEAPPSERRTRQNEALCKADVEVLPPETLVSLAALDARQYRALRNPQRQAEAARVMAETVRLDGAYRVALTEQAPNLAQVVQIVAAATDNAKLANATPIRGAPANAQPNQSEPSVSNAPRLAIDASTLAHLAAKRTRDFSQAAKQLGLNGIEPVSDQAPKSPPKEPEQQAQAERPTLAKKSEPTQGQAPDTNRLTSDEVFTATREETKPIVPIDVESRYLRVGNKFYHPKNTSVVAFVDKGNQLQTRSDSEHIAASMVAIARARSWDEIKVSGSKTFRQEVWREATAHGMHVKGYTPTEIDKAELAKRTTQLTTNQLERDDKGPAHDRLADRAQPKTANLHKDAPPTDAERETKPNDQPNKAGQNTHGIDSDAMATARTQNDTKADVSATSQPSSHRQRAQAFAQLSPDDALVAHPELAGAYAAKAAIEKKVATDGLSPQQSAIVRARVEENLVNSIERGDLPQMKMREQVDVRRERTEQREVKR